MGNPFRDNIIGMAEDEKVTCRGCKETWYAKWFKDGFCHTCQNDGTYDEYLYQLGLSNSLNFVFKVGVLIVLIALIILFTFI